MMLPPDSPPDDMCDPMCDEERGAYNESSRLASARPPLTRPLTPNGPASAAVRLPYRYRYVWPRFKDTGVRGASRRFEARAVRPSTIRNVRHRSLHTSLTHHHTYAPQPYTFRSTETVPCSMQRPESALKYMCTPHA